jgi:hypothetical protein
MLMMVGIMLFKMLQKSFYQLTPRRKDCQTNQNKYKPLKEREKKANNPQDNE